MLDASSICDRLMSEADRVDVGALSSNEIENPGLRCSRNKAACLRHLADLAREYRYPDMPRTASNAAPILLPDLAISAPASRPEACAGSPHEAVIHTEPSNVGLTNIPVGTRRRTPKSLNSLPAIWRTIRVRRAARLICVLCKVDPMEAFDRKRSTKAGIPAFRMLVRYLRRKGKSTLEIGQLLNRDHSTIVYHIHGKKGSCRS